MRPLTPQRKDYAQAANLLRHANEAWLSTLSLEQNGFPFGSLTEIQLSKRNCPVFWASQLAQHTKNLQANPRVCIGLLEPGAGRDRARLSWLGQAKPAFEDREQLKEAYLRKNLQAAQFLDLPDFLPFEVAPESIYFIGGFGRAFWLEPALLFEFL